MASASTTSNQPSPSSVPQAAQQPASPQPAPVVRVPQPILTPTGTISVSITPPPNVQVPFYGNVVFWVSVLSFIGVVLTLWQARTRLTKELDASEKRLQKQLDASAGEATLERNQSREQAKLDREHAATQAHQERITKARREVYLELISEMMKAQITMSTLPLQDIRSLDINAGFGGLMTATSKIGLLGEMATVRISRELLTLIQETLMRAMVLLVPIDAHKHSRQFHEEQSAAHQSEIDKLSPEYNELVRKTVSSVRTAQLAKELRYHHVEAETHSKAAISAGVELAKEERKFHALVLAETRSIARKTNELIHSMRTELALDTSLEELHATTEVMYSAAVASLKRLHEALDEMNKSE